MILSSSISFSERNLIVSKYLTPLTGRLMIQNAKKLIAEHKIPVSKLHKSESETIYLWVNGLSSGVLCKVCGKPTTFLSFKNGYREVCSISCSKKDPEYQNRVKSNMITKYGVEHQMKLKSVKDKMKMTMIDRYGIENALSKGSSFKIKGLQQKYGNDVINISQTDHWKKNN